MERQVRLLEGLQSLPRDEFVSRPEHHQFAERCFQIAIQCLLDTCLYLASQRGWEKPEDSPGAIMLMSRQGVLP